MRYKFMKTCLKCGSTMFDDDEFCTECGFEDILFCRECGAKRRQEAFFCPSCGKPYYSPTETENFVEANPQELSLSDEKSISNIENTDISVEKADNDGEFIDDISITEPDITTNKESTQSNSLPKKRIHIWPIIVSFIGVLVAVAITVLIIKYPSIQYNKAVKAYDAGDYEKAYNYFQSAGNFNDAKTKAQDSAVRMHYANGKAAFDIENYTLAKEEFTQAGDYSDAKEMAKESEFAIKYLEGQKNLESGDYLSAISSFELCKDYKDSSELIKLCNYKLGEDALSKEAFDDAYKYFTNAGDYKDSATRLSETLYKRAETELSKGNTLTAAAYFEQAGDYKDANERYRDIYYNLGTDALNKKDYDKAAEYLRLAGDYKDAANKGLIAYYYKAVSLINKKEYDEAGKYLVLSENYKESKTLLANTLSKLIKVNDYENAKILVSHFSGNDLVKYSYYIDGMIAYNAKKYEDAAKFFLNCNSFLNSSELYKESLYNHGINLLLSGTYNRASNIFKELGKYKYASDLANVSNAELHYNLGDYTVAASLYSKVSKNVKITGFDVQSRKTHAITKGTLVKIKGKWRVNSQDVYAVWSYPDGSSSKNSLNTTYTGQYINLTYTENDDGTFNINGEIIYTRYIKFKDTNDYVVPEYPTATINLKNIKSFPSVIKIDYSTQLQYKNGVFTLKYSYDYKCDKFTTKCRSTIKYKR